MQSIIYILLAMASIATAQDVSVIPTATSELIIPVTTQTVYYTSQTQQAAGSTVIVTVPSATTIAQTLITTYYNPPQPTTTYVQNSGICIDGYFKCASNGINYFDKCDHGRWVNFMCAPGTVCYTISDSRTLCDWPGLSVSSDGSTTYGTGYGSGSGSSSSNGGTGSSNNGGSNCNGNNNGGTGTGTGSNNNGGGSTTCSSCTDCGPEQQNGVIQYGQFSLARKRTSSVLVSLSAMAAGAVAFIYAS